MYDTNNDVKGVSLERRSGLNKSALEQEPRPGSDASHRGSLRSYLHQSRTLASQVCLSRQGRACRARTNMAFH